MSKFPKSLLCRSSTGCCGSQTGPFLCDRRITSPCGWNRDWRRPHRENQNHVHIHIPSGEVYRWNGISPSKPTNVCCQMPVSSARHLKLANAPGVNGTGWSYAAGRPPTSCWGNPVFVRDFCGSFFVKRAETRFRRASDIGRPLRITSLSFSTSQVFSSPGRNIRQLMARWSGDRSISARSFPD